MNDIDSKNHKELAILIKRFNKRSQNDWNASLKRKSNRCHAQEQVIAKLFLRKKIKL